MIMLGISDDVFELILLISHRNSFILFL